MCVIEPASAVDWSEALELAFASVPEDERHRHVVNCLALLTGGELHACIWVARAGRLIVGVQVCEVLGGATCLFWPPRARADYAHLRVRLVEAGVAWSRQHHYKIAQALLPMDELDAGPLVGAGFRHVTELHSLRHDLFEAPAAAASLRFQPYALDPRLFEQTMLRTYEATLDCPELNGVRTIDEILAGHRAAGKDRPELWQLAVEGHQPVGAVLLTELPHSLDWELSYLGVIPEARGQGLGRQLTQHAIALARNDQVLHLILAVDVRNTPALRLYESLGFELIDRRRVYLQFLSARMGFV